MKYKRCIGIFLIISVLMISNLNTGVVVYADENQNEVQEVEENDVTDEQYEMQQENKEDEDESDEKIINNEVGEEAVPETITGMDQEGNIINVEDEAGIVEVDLQSNDGKIVNFNTKGGVVTTYTEVDTGNSGYTCGLYGADAAYLGMQNGKVEFMLSGVIGLVDSSEVQVVNINSAASISYYNVSNGRLIHNITTNITKSNYVTSVDNGPAPTYLAEGIYYYSYDGHYFYTRDRFSNMLEDYMAGVRVNSVNSSTPYYNYYQYLPLRSKTTYSPSQLNEIINNRAAGYKMCNTGDAFTNYQNTYGVNALIAVGIAANESGWGKSNIAQEKNNLFGLNAVDTSPGQSANTYQSVDACIKTFAETYMSKQYLNPQNWVYSGAYLGNKGSGMNVRYASDPYWGEKNANIAWMIDKIYENVDSEQYTLGIKDIIGNEHTNLNVRSEASSSARVIHTTKAYSNQSFSVLGDSQNGFYKVQSDAVLTSDRMAVSDVGNYNFDNMYVYVSSDYVKIVSKGKDIQNGSSLQLVVENGITYCYKGSEKQYGEQRIDGKWYYFDKVSGAMQTGFCNLGNKTVYYDASGVMQYGEKRIEEKWYYFDKVSGAMQTGFCNLGNKMVYYDANGVMQYGEKRIDEKWYYFDKVSGAMQTGFCNLGNKMVYYDANGVMQYGEKRIEEKWYYFDKVNGAMQTGFCDLGNKTVYYDASGAMQYGERRIDGKWYYFDKVNGAMQIGFCNLGNKTVYYDANGVMQYGEKRIDGKWYYFDKVSGAMQTDFCNLGNKMVYYDANGVMQYGEKRIDGKWYYFDKVSGAMQTGFCNLGNKVVYYDANGVMQYGEKRIDGKWYYFDKVSGAMQTGFCNLENKTVYYDTTGVMQYGKKKIDGKWYYFDEVTGAMRIE